ncbi:MAG: GIY-YIG nuclease family protein [Acidobacteria bacterium]|nr:GIY-YIG nuclease family protein [Acidobacteriota bacterium]
MASRSRNLYTGITNNLTHGTFQHRESHAKAFTTRYRIHRLVYFERYRDVRNAIKREKEIKGWRRSKKLALIEQHNPAWDDLGAEWFPAPYPRKADPSLRSG